MTEVSDDGPEAFWNWGRFGIDFVCEDGKWKIWHMLICTDFTTPLGTSWADPNNKPKIPSGIEIPAPTKPGPVFFEYTPEQATQEIPRVPDPYYTFADTFSY